MPVVIHIFIYFFHTVYFNYIHSTPPRSSLPTFVIYLCLKNQKTNENNNNMKIKSNKNTGRKLTLKTITKTKLCCVTTPGFGPTLECG